MSWIVNVRFRSLIAKAKRKSKCDAFTAILRQLRIRHPGLSYPDLWSGLLAGSVETFCFDKESSLNLFLSFLESTPTLSYELTPLREAK